MSNYPNYILDFGNVYVHDYIKRFCADGLGEHLTKYNWKCTAFNFKRGYGGYRKYNEPGNVLSTVRALYDNSNIDDIRKVDFDSICHFIPAYYSDVMSGFLNGGYVQKERHDVCKLYMRSCLVLLWGWYRRSFKNCMKTYDFHLVDDSNLIGHQYYLDQWEEARDVISKQNSRGRICSIYTCPYPKAREDVNFSGINVGELLTSDAPFIKTKDGFYIVKELDLNLPIETIFNFLEPYEILEYNLMCGYPEPFPWDNHDKSRNESWSSSPRGFVHYFKSTCSRQDPNYKYIGNAIALAKAARVRYNLITSFRNLVEFYFIFSAGGQELYNRQRKRQYELGVHNLLKGEVADNIARGYGPVTHNDVCNFINSYHKSNKEVIPREEGDWSGANGLFAYLRYRFRKLFG